MPRGYRIGLACVGRMMGRKSGFCAGFKMPGFLNSSMRKGLCFDRGR